MDIKNSCGISSNFSEHEKYLLRILRSEAKMSECLQDLFCNSLLEELKSTEPIEKRITLARSIICAYSMKEEAMAKLIASLKLPPIKYCVIKQDNYQFCKPMNNRRTHY